MRCEVFFVLILSALVYADQLSEPSDAELENFQRAVKQKRAAADSKTIMKCVAPQVNSKNRKSEAQEAEEIALCILAEATKKEQEKRDSAADMVRRMSDLVENDALVVSRRGWWRKTVNWAKKHWEAIKKGIKIAGDIIKAIWGKGK